ncbi:MAG TPA: DUF6644 family protein [Steroidobacteraceae bacterium]|nr:DUF6644 family protein [Steroidobacteraceae bacterium]
MHAFAAWLQASSASNTIQSVSWVIPLLQSIHILMIGVVFVSSLMIALRVLGLMRVDQPFEAVWHRFAPWMWSALIVMAGTGLLLVLGEPIREFTALSFWIKMLLLAAGVTSTALYGHALKSGVRVRGSAEFSAGAKAMSILLVALWLSVVFLGRAIAYDREVWGALSLHA